MILFLLGFITGAATIVVFPAALALWQWRGKTSVWLFP